MGMIGRTLKRAFRRKAVTPARRAIRRKITRPARKRIERASSVTCSTCGKRYTNPLTHTCAVRTDFKKRKAAAGRRAAAELRRQRRREAAARKRAAAKARRKAAADRRKAAAAARRQAAKRSQAPRRLPAHDYHTCGDQDCRRHACVAYRDGIEDCPLPHQ
jgi:hypothetical protein